MKLLIWAGAVVVVCAGLAAGWYYQPWSQYSPSRMLALNDPANYAQNFRTMGSLIPDRPVRKGETVKPFAEQLAPLELKYTYNGQQKTLAQFLNESTTTSLIVVKQGVIRHERYLQGSQRESLFTSWSVAKSFVATALMIAYKDGLIESLDDPAEKYAPQFSGSDFGSSSLRSLLAMSSGIEFDEDYFSDDSDIRPFFFDSFVLRKNPDNLLLKFKRSRAEFSDFHYISSNSHVLSAVLRAVYQQPLADIISEKIWQPLQMEADASWLQHRDGDDAIALGYCCLNARSRDYARFGQFYLEGYQGRGLGAELLPNGWAQSLNKPVGPTHQVGSDRYQGRGYSWHFWLPPNNPEVFIAVGVYGQYIWIDPGHDLVIVRTSADPDFMPRYAESQRVFEAITAYYQ